jgi:hypothetical protein
MICKYVHRDVEIKGKAQDFARKFTTYLKPSFPKVMEDLECRKARLNIKDNERWIVEGSPFITFALTQNYEIKIHQDNDNMMAFASSYGTRAMEDHMKERHFLLARI